MAKVIIIGAGPAGITCARELKEAGVGSVVVEAQGRIGGRVLNSHQSEDPKMRAFSKLPMEIGAEFMHGSENNVLFEWIKKHGVKGKPKASTMSLKWPNYLYYGKEGRLVDEDGAEKDEDLQRMFKVFDMLGEMDPELVPEESLLQYFARMGVPSRVLDMGDAIFANDYAAEGCDVGIKETVQEQTTWTYGEDYLVLHNCTYSDILKDMAEGLEIKYNWKVREIAYSDAESKVTVTSDAGEVLTGSRAIVCVPQNSLADGHISFKPEIPAPQQQALSKIRMGNACKILIKLNKAIWPKDFWDCVCSDSFVPEIWVTPAAAILSGQGSADEHIVVGFVAGKRSDRLRKLSEETRKRLFLSQLDAMFGTQADPNPATHAFVDCMIMDWGVDPLFRGAYSFPTIGGRDARALMSTPLKQRVHFAGEAMNRNINPCINGAMESATIAVSEVLEGLGQPRKPAAKL